MSRFAIVLAAAIQLATCALGQPAATVIDKKGTRAEIDRVKTESVGFRAGEFEWRIPVNMIASLSSTPDGKNLVLRTVNGVDLTGECSEPEKFEGTWELGEYAVSFSDIKSLVFPRAGGQPKEPPSAAGYVVRVKTRNGGTFELMDAALSFRTYGCDNSWVPPQSYTIQNRRFFLPLRYKHCTIAVPFADVDKLASSGLTDDDWSSAKVSLRAGRTLDCQVVSLGNAFEHITGKAAFGEAAVPLGPWRDKGKILEIVFLRDKSDKPVRQGFEKELGGSLDSSYTASVVTWDNTNLVLANVCTVNEDDAYEWGNRATTLDVKIGEAENKVSFATIKRVDFQKWKPPTGPGLQANPPITGKMTTESGKTLDVSLYSWWRLAGNLEDLGPGILELKDVKSLEIRQKEK